MKLIDIQLFSLAAAIMAMAVYIARWEGMILEPLDKYLREALPKYIYKPLIGCVYCNAFWWGVLAGFVHCVWQMHAIFQDAGTLALPFGMVAIVLHGCAAMVLTALMVGTSSK
jgi:hypothetical protein